MSNLAESNVVRCDDRLIQAAFELYVVLYGQVKNWSIPYKISMWQRAARAFDLKSHADFEFVYDQLRRYWQVFRRSPRVWTAEETFNALMGHCSKLRSQRLAEITISDVPHLRDMLQSMHGIKQTKGGSSTVAVSKFLHFWNPRLFVIVDDALVWKWALAHHWLRDQIRRTQEETDTIVFGRPRYRNDRKCDLDTYLAVLVWAGRFVRANPQLPLHFADCVRSHAGEAELPTDIAEYEAAAIEWFLLGVVEIPPVGWNVVPDGPQLQQFITPT